MFCLCSEAVKDGQTNPTMVYFKGGFNFHVSVMECEMKCWRQQDTGPFTASLHVLFCISMLTFPRLSLVCLHFRFYDPSGCYYGFLEVEGEKRGLELLPFPLLCCGWWQVVVVWECL